MGWDGVNPFLVEFLSWTIEVLWSQNRNIPPIFTPAPQNQADQSISANSMRLHLPPACSCLRPTLWRRQRKWPRGTEQGCRHHHHRTRCRSRRGARRCWQRRRGGRRRGSTTRGRSTPWTLTYRTHGRLPPWLPCHLICFYFFFNCPI
jgi:hypothetical protein